MGKRTHVHVCINSWHTLVILQVIPCLRRQLLSMKEKDFPLCVDVKGCLKRTREVESLQAASLMIEQWTVQTISKRLRVYFHTLLFDCHFLHVRVHVLYLGGIICRLHIVH